jgi:hypothetical protein
MMLRWWDAVNAQHSLDDAAQPGIVAAAAQKKKPGS